MAFSPTCSNAFASSLHPVTSARNTRMAQSRSQQLVKFMSEQFLRNGTCVEVVNYALFADEIGGRYAVYAERVLNRRASVKTDGECDFIPAHEIPHLRFGIVYSHSQEHDSLGPVFAGKLFYGRHFLTARQGPWRGRHDQGR